VATESMYRAPGNYHGAHPQVPPIHTYVGNMYDYPMVQPMSAVPYSPYGMDHYTLFSMVTTQLYVYRLLLDSKTANTG
jgi:la-related protein 1